MVTPAAQPADQFALELQSLAQSTSFHLRSPRDYLSRAPPAQSQAGVPAATGSGAEDRWNRTWQPDIIDG